MRCPSCHAELPDGVAVCTACGHVLGEDTAELTSPGAAGAASRKGLVGRAVRSLLVVSGHDIGKEFELADGTFVIGRDPAADIFLNDITVTRRHASLTVTPFKAELADLGSLNGTYVNGLPIDRVDLADGDEIQIGKFKLLYTDRRGE